MKGTIRHQNVSRMKPGTISRTKPIVTPMPAKMEAPITGRMKGPAARTVWDRSRSTRRARRQRPVGRDHLVKRTAPDEFHDNPRAPTFFDDVVNRGHAR